MKIALLSDSHDNVEAMAEAVRRCSASGIDAILFAGDMVAPFTAKRLMEFGGPVYAVYGNNDGERNGLKSVVGDIVDGPRTLTLNGRRIVMTHDPATLGPDDESADLAVWGHTHALSVEEGPPLKINPGEIGGWLTGRRTFCVVDLVDMRVTTIDF